ncbi:BMP family ABC transporter substrate-binding protein [Clostridium tyrobutyricum]|uniref:Membrane protein, Bmp family n=4 Tax=Clostridium tyrobutyricum TaxID=1519 RepID=W6NET9_CLOTY|nr:BMP family ABC transporter substrate-binding protein [Clostridium tyrobutyricum]AND84040.1 Bmp family membrane protein [Clostridium tyrobutyricum]ANP68775.1 BMP family ABC transporter substrate-binding protein [Clostridium tyrobutyricum]MBV4433549.1 BMP family ABC transporter substrate-binding protein [Clostridium tyrobutyricum]MBV4433550.1 BMP family ABC transporter substrate-binding protein [Clostridium tyrobutyricum]MBV4439114.1 BMP family ABC transporter substrate-binding protein [Clost
MKKKKILTFLLTLVVITGLFAGCSSSKTSSTGITTTSQGKKIDKDKIKVGFIYLAAVGDGGWNDAHNDGRLALEKMGIKTIYKENVPESQKVQTVIEDMINQGCNVIIGTSFGYMDYMYKEAQKHPDIIFLHNTGYKTADNMGVYIGRLYEATYLSGIVAGMKTKTNKIGVVASMPIPELYRQINAFALGVQSVNKKAVVNVKWTHTWYDPAKEKEAGKALVDQGNDVISEEQDTTSALDAAQEKGLAGIGFDRDKKNADPKMYMTAPVYNWSVYYKEQINDLIAGKWKSQSWLKGLESGVVDLAPIRDQSAPAGAKEAVAKAKADISSGKLKVYVGPIKDQKGELKVKAGQSLDDAYLQKIDWFVQGINGANEK